jgi:biofilm PGA synthesis lipoprotein PgaB
MYWRILKVSYRNYITLLSGLFMISFFGILAIKSQTPSTNKNLIQSSSYNLPNQAFQKIDTACQTSKNIVSSSSLSRKSNLDLPSSLSCSNLTNANNIIESLSIQKQSLVLENWQNTLASQVPQLAPWPNIHREAKLAKVPVMMYHDILAKKEVFFDVTPQELEKHFQLIKEKGLTPISLDWLISHLRTGIPLPEKPILLTFDDGYGGHYQYVYPLLKKYGYPAVFSIYINKMDGKTKRSSITWEQLKEMAEDPLVTITSHSVTHPKDLRTLSDDELSKEIIESKQILEKELGKPIIYFTYPEGKHDARVKQWIAAAGYRAALAMNDNDEHFAGDSPDLLSIGRFGQSGLSNVILHAWGGYPLSQINTGFNFDTPIYKREFTVDQTTVILIIGGVPKTIHADSRYQVPEIIQKTDAIAAVDGGFFSLKYLDSNIMIGPVMSQGGEFIQGYEGEIHKLKGRPLILITPKSVQFVPFDPNRHNTLTGIAAEAGEVVTDTFVAAAWLVKNGQPQKAESFKSLFDFDAMRHRAFWGINQSGQPVIGVSKNPVDSVSLGKILAHLGLRDAVMLDSGASTSLAYQGESLVGYTPRPVPHVVALFPPPSPIPLPVSHVGLPCVLLEDSCR